MARGKKRSSISASATSDGAELFETPAGADASAAVPTLASVLQVLTHARIGALARDLGVVVPAFTNPVTPAEQAARQAFEDEVIDQRFVLNAERAKEEERAGVSNRRKKGKKTAKKTSKAEEDDDGQQSMV